MRNSDLISLVRSHYQGNEHFFRTLVQQAFARKGGEELKRALEHLVNQPTLMTLPPAAQKFLTPIKDFDGELVLQDSVGEALVAIEREFAGRARLEERGISPRCRFLFCGPPGNGKTSAAALLAKRLQLSAFSVSLTSVVDSHMGVTGHNLRDLFTALNRDVMLVADEIDSIGMARESGGAAEKESSRVVNSLLTLLDAHQGGILVATTNRADLLDPALRRRFDLELQFPAPDDQLRQRVLVACCARYGIDRRLVNLDAGIKDESLDSVTKRVLDVARAEILRGAA